jgi:hypothetical protein
LEAPEHRLPPLSPFDLESGKARAEAPKKARPRRHGIMRAAGGVRRSRGT